MENGDFCCWKLIKCLFKMIDSAVKNDEFCIKHYLWGRNYDVVNELVEEATGLFLCWNEDSSAKTSWLRQEIRTVLYWKWWNLHWKWWIFCCHHREARADGLHGAPAEVYRYAYGAGGAHVHRARYGFNYKKRCLHAKHDDYPPIKWWFWLINDDFVLINDDFVLIKWRCFPSKGDVGLHNVIVHPTENTVNALIGTDFDRVLWPILAYFGPILGWWWTNISSVLAQ